MSGLPLLSCLLSVQRGGRVMLVTDRQPLVPMQDTENPKDVVGERKPPLHLIPAAAEVAESVVMGLGAKKYGPFNWRRTKVKASVYVAAARRHLLQWFDGEDNDPESGASHLAHARACLGILLDAIVTGHVVDDRPPRGAASELIATFTEPEGPSVALARPTPRRNRTPRRG